MYGDTSSQGVAASVRALTRDAFPQGVEGGTEKLASGLDCSGMNHAITKSLQDYHNCAAALK